MSDFVSSSAALRTKNRFAVMVTKNAALKNSGLSSGTACQKMPIGTGFKEGFHTERSTPVEIIEWITAIAEPRRHGNDSLMLVVGESDKHMHNGSAGLRETGMVGENEDEERSHCRQA